MARENYLIVLFCLFIISSLSNSCEFEPHKVYERTVIENVSAPEIQIIELNLEYDTIFLYGSKQVRFNFQSSDQGILAVRFTIDNEEEYLVKSNKGTFYLDYRMATNGIHSLVLEVFTESGSGSIAEIFGREGFVFSKSWVLYIDENYNHNVQSTINNGFLKLSWNRYRGYDFRRYIILRTLWNFDLEMGRTRSEFFTDSSYVGEQARYDVKVLTTDGTILPWGYIEFEKNLPKLSYSASVENEYIIKWNKCKYFGAVDSFRISLITNKGVNADTKSINSLNDTTYIIPKSYFGRNVEITVRIVPKNSLLYVPDYYSFFESYLEPCIIGFRFSSSGVEEVHQVGRNEFIYWSGDNSLKRYSVSENRIVERFGYPTTDCSMYNFINSQVSQSGKFMTTYVDCTNDVMLLNTANLTSNTKRNVKFLSGQLYNPPVPVSDNGNVLINKIDGGFYLYNFFSDSVLAFYFKDLFFAKGLAISSCGDYILLENDSLRLVHYNNSQFRNIWTHCRISKPEFFEFDGKDPDRFVIWKDKTLSVRKCSDFSEIYNFHLEDQMILDIDYYNGTLLTWSPGHLYVRRHIDGSLLHDVAYSLHPGLWYNSCRLVGDAIICTQGVLYFLEGN